MCYTILPVFEDDLPALQAVSRKTFYDAFAWYNTPEDMQYYLDNNLSLAQLAEELNTPGTYFFLAREGDKAIG